MGLLEGIARGEKAIEQGRTLTHAQARRRMARWLKQPGQATCDPTGRRDYAPMPSANQSA